MIWKTESDDNGASTCSVFSPLACEGELKPQLEQGGRSSLKGEGLHAVWEETQSPVCQTLHRRG